MWVGEMNDDPMFWRNRMGRQKTWKDYTPQELYKFAVIVWEHMPETLTHMDNVDLDEILRMKFQLKVAGLEFRDNGPVEELLVILTRGGILRTSVKEDCVGRGLHPDIAWQQQANTITVEDVR